MMKTIATAFLLAFLGGCGDEDESCGSGTTESRCTSDSQCQSCNCYVPPESESGICLPAEN